MKTHAVALIAAMTLHIGGAALYPGVALALDERPFAAVGGSGGPFLEIRPMAPVGAHLTLDAGDFSPSTGEMITGSAWYLSASFELTGAREQAMFGAEPKRMLIFTPTSGRYVVRFLDRITAN